MFLNPPIPDVPDLIRLQFDEKLQWVTYYIFAGNFAVAFEANDIIVITDAAVVNNYILDVDVDSIVAPVLMAVYAATIIRTPSFSNGHKVERAEFRR